MVDITRRRASRGGIPHPAIFEKRGILEVFQAEESPFDKFVSRGDLLDEIDIPGPHQAIDFAVGEVLEVILDTRVPRIISITGENGAGKTHLYWAFKKTFYSQARFIFIPAPILYQERSHSPLHSARWRGWAKTACTKSLQIWPQIGAVIQRFMAYFARQTWKELFSGQSIWSPWGEYSARGRGLY